MRKLHEKKISELKMGYHTWGEGVDYDVDTQDYLKTFGGEAMLMSVETLREWAIAVVKECNRHIRLNCRCRRYRHKGKTKEQMYESQPHTIFELVLITPQVKAIRMMFTKKFEIKEEELK